MINLRDNYYAVQVPEGAIKFRIDMGYLIWRQPNYKNWANDSILSDYSKLSKYLETHSAENDYKTGGMLLPDGQWQIVCTSKDWTSKQAREIVERLHPGGFGRSIEEWKNYTNPGICFDPVYSLHTLLTSKGCDVKNNYIILKKIA